MKKRFVITGIITGIVTILIIGLLLWTRQPATGRITTASVPPKTVSNAQTKKLDGAYISFEYKGEYSAKPQSAADGSIERYVLDTSSQDNRQILASVTELPGGKLESNGNYIYRVKSPDVYESRTFDNGKQTITVWVKKDGTEQTAMIPSGNRLAVISFVSAGGSQVITTEDMNTLLKSFAWK